jgi:DNA-binding MarR family transcriptional regulator
MKKTPEKPAPTVEPVDCLASIFTARRDLLLPIRRAVLKELPLTVDEGDTLTLLYGLRKLGWTDVPVDRDGFVAVGDLRRALVHDPGKFSRRIKDGVKRGLIEVRKSAVRRKYAEAVRITEAGAKIAKQVWDRYRKLAAHLLEGVPQADLEAHCRVNEAISASIKAKQRNPWEGLTA